MKNNNNQLFDRFAKDYRAVHTKSLELTGADSEYYSEYKIVEVLRRSIHPSQGAILDFGCGDGTSLHYFRKYFPNHLLHGIDVSKESISVAERKELNNCQLAVFDGLNVPFEDGVFDIVFLANVLHHVPFENHHKVLSECRRVLKAGGKIYIFEHNPLNPVTRKIFNDCIFDKYAEMIRCKSLHKKLKSASFEAVKTSFYLFFPRHKIFSLFHRLEKHLSFIPIGGQYCLAGKKY